uniref:Uncharacterized protein n=1 Tax=Oncorhynchus tshawytscha TaxID=74940 RepID=A0AAZ3P041_ONCTS
ILSLELKCLPGSVRPVRGPGDGMETDKPPVAKEIGAQSPRASPRATPSAPQPPGVLHLGKVPREACMVVEAVRIVVPRAAISRSGGHVGPAEEKGEAWAGQQIEERPPSPSPPLEDLRGAMEKLQNSERRLLQDKEGLLNQLHVQTEVNRELKKLLVASEVMTCSTILSVWPEEEHRHDLTQNEALGRSRASTAEQLEHVYTMMSGGQVPSGRGEGTSHTDDVFVCLSPRSLEQLLVSLQWGRQQTYYPSGQPLSTGELALANHKLADAINSRLLGKVGPVGSSSGAGLGKGRQSSELPNTSHTPAEKMAEKVLKILDPISCSDNEEEPSPLSISDSSPSAFLTNKKSIGRFHPYTRYENITFNCCERCSGDILVL